MGYFINAFLDAKRIANRSEQSPGVILNAERCYKIHYSCVAPVLVSRTAYIFSTYEISSNLLKCSTWVKLRVKVRDRDPMKMVSL